MSEPFGALAPSPLQERFRAVGHRLPANYFGRKAASLLLGPAGGRRRRAYDVAIFGTQRARLHPHDNICEKRVYLTPQLWDGAERAFLADAISAFAGGIFHFVDVGANVGLYTLFARAEAMRAGALLRAVCIEADAEMVARLQFNLDASDTAGAVAVFNCAASDRDATLRLAVNRKSRGLSRIAETGGAPVAARPLLSMIVEAGLERIDALKIDIEGHEHAALGAFFRDAPRGLHPALLLLEISHADADRAAERVVLDAGYVERFRTARNAGFVIDRQTPG